MPEQLAFEEGFDDRGAVAYGKAAVGDRTKGVQSLGGQFLSGSGSAADQGDAVMGGDAADAGEDIQHEWTAADHAVETTGFQKTFIQGEGFVPQAGMMEQFLKFLPKVFRRDGLDRQRRLPAGCPQRQRQDYSVR